MLSPHYEKIIIPTNDIKSIKINVAERDFPISLKGLQGPGTPTFIVIEMNKEEVTDHA